MIHYSHNVLEVSILVFLEWPLGPSAGDQRAGRAIMFQSLFFWNGLWDRDRLLVAHLPHDVSILVFLEWPLGPRAHPRHKEDHVKFQSLFFWNGLWDPAWMERVSRYVPCFNPCFSGMAFGTLPGWRGYPDIYRVSILVFLEWPLGPRHRRRHGRRQRVSILVFLEWPLGQNI